MLRRDVPQQPHQMAQRRVGRLDLSMRSGWPGHENAAVVDT